MPNHVFYLLLASMILNLIVVGYCLNKPNAAVPVSLSGLSIVLQGLIMRFLIFTSA